jgi:hypothetical protein
MAPHCDIATGKIYGCKEGSWMWWHEKGHLKYNSLEISGNMAAIQQIINWAWMLSITLSLLNKYMLIISLPCVLINIGIDIYEEIWCNKYANKMYKGRAKRWQGIIGSS